MLTCFSCFVALVITIQTGSQVRKGYSYSEIVGPLLTQTQIVGPLIYPKIKFSLAKSTRNFVFSYARICSFFFLGP